MPIRRSSDPAQGALEFGVVYEVDETLVCYFGTPRAHHHNGIGCVWCELAVSESIRAFWQDVGNGIYDAEGYTKADRAEVERRRLDSGPLVVRQS